MKIYPRALELKLIGVREKYSYAERKDMCDRKLSEVGKERNHLPTMILFNTIFTDEKLFIILKASFPIILNLLVSRK